MLNLNRISTYLALLLLPSLLANAAPIELAGEGLTESTWNVVDKGVWLVEHYSPYCSHCRAFAPKWKELVEMYSLTAPQHSFNFAQVDCASNGDLCHQHGVKYYPSIFLYEDGKFKEEFVDKRSVEELARYVERNWREPKTPARLEVEEEQVGMGESRENVGKGTRPRLGKGAEKARLPKLHLTDEEEESGGKGKATEEKGGAKPYDELLQDASSKVEALLHPTQHLEESVDSQRMTPTTIDDSSSASPATRPMPQLLAQQPETKRSAEAEGSPVTAEWEKSRGSPDGTVRLLKKEDAERLKDQEAGPSFVKFYAPWCGHCKNLAPHWTELASSLESQVHVYEIDCDTAENKAICRKEGVQAYPTLIFYNRGAVVEYHGKREENAMKAWAMKTIHSTTIGHISSEYDLERAAQQDPVVVVLLHTTDTNKDDLSLAREAAKSQMGSTPFYASTSPELFSLFSLSPSSPPTFLVFKSSSLTPTATFALPASPLTKRKRIELTKNWLRGAKLPVVSELDGSSYAQLFPEDSDPSLPYVVLGFFSKKGLKGEFDETLRKFKNLAKEWNEMKKDKNSRDVAWAWVDGDRWMPWARTSYDVKMGALHSPVMLVSDPNDRVYWKNDVGGSPLHVDDSKVFDLIRSGIYTGKTPGVSSDGFVGRWSKALVKRSASIFSTAMDHPFLSFFALVCSWVGFAYLLKKLFSSSSSIQSGNSAKSEDYAKKD